MEQKKKRAPNYTIREKKVILHLISKHKNIIENKKTDAVSVSDKNDAWFKITEKFNTLCPNNVFRPIDSLKKFYENLKEDLRKRAGKEKRSIDKTGGGPPSPKRKPEDDILLGIINKKSVFGVDSQFDNDIDDLDENIQKQIVGSGDENATRNDSRVSMEKNRKVSLQSPPIIEIVSENEQGGNKQEVDGNKSCAKYGAAKFKKTNIRRRPTTIKVLTSSALAEKYSMLIDKKLELAECLKKEHHMRMKILNFDLEMRKKGLKSAGYTDMDIQLLDSCKLNL